VSSLFRYTPFPDSKPPERIESAAKRQLRNPSLRYFFLLGLCCLIFVGLGGRLAQLALSAAPEARSRTDGSEHLQRAKIVDRNGRLLADHIPVYEVFIRPVETARGGQFSHDQNAALKQIFPDLDTTSLRRAVEAGSARFRFVARRASARQWAEAQALGIVGLEAREISARVYPPGRQVAHIIGGVDVDGKGVAGIERQLQERLTDPDTLGEPLELSVDLRVQNALRQTLFEAQSQFHALGAAGLVMDVRTGEMLSLVSLPDFDPNNRPEPPRGDAEAQAASPLFNRATQGAYDLGSVFKLFTAATALETKVAQIDTPVDARRPIRRGNYTISDYLGKSRVLTLEEVIRYSSNIGAVRIAELYGAKVQQDYLAHFGLAERVALDELPPAERARPLLPAKWDAAEVATVAYGHGISVSPLHLATAIASIANDGCRVKPTLLRLKEAPTVCNRVVRSEVSTQIRSLMRTVGRLSSGRSANIPGYEIGGKTGTAHKVRPVGGYDLSKRFNSFVALWPTTEPKYLMVVSLDDPKLLRTPGLDPLAGRTAAPTAGRAIERIAPLLGEAPMDRFRPQPSPDEVDEISEGGALPIFIEDEEVGG